MKQLYTGAGSGPPDTILVAHRLDSTEGRQSLLALIFGWPGLMLISMDERTIIAVLPPGGALLTGSGKCGA